MREKLYKWYPIVDEGEYWLNADANPLDNTPIRTIVTNGKFLWTYEDCKIGWSLMAAQGNWKYMRINIEDISCREESVNDKMCRMTSNN